MSERKPGGPKRAAAGKGGVPAPATAPPKASPSRKPPPRKGGRGGGRKKGSRGFRRLARELLAGLAWRLAALGLGAALGLLLVVHLLYRQALADVDTLIAAPLASQSGRVLSGPLELWPGLRASVEEVAQDLQRAGYARVGERKQPGDFTVQGDRILLWVPTASGPGWKTREEQVELRFKEGRIALANGKTRLRLAPAELWLVRGPENEARRAVPLAQIPTALVEAVLAMEDSRFREHEGLDPLGISRALVVNAWTGRTAQGGSTLTQQLVKNLFLSRERTYQRKAREAFLAVAIEQRLSKDEILELYLNEIYLGQAGGASVHGVDQAARAFFGKPVQRLDLSEAATIAGIISAPNRWSPLRDPEEALKRRDIALARMVEVGVLGEEKAAAARALPLQVHALSGGRVSPWGVDAALLAAEDVLGVGSVAAEGLSLHTSIQPALQRLAEAAVATSLAELEAEHPGARGVQMSLLAVRVSDGSILALVGGRDYADSSFDRALHGRRQLGSTVKPLTWLFALDADPALSPGSILVDEPITRTIDGKSWSPRNYDGAFVGPISLRDALVTSRNVPAVLLAEKVGLRTLATRWKAAGLSRATDWPSAALGSFEGSPLELAQAYSVFPRGGSTVEPRLLRAIVDAEGTLRHEAPEPTVHKLADPVSAFLVSDALREVLVRGTGRRAGSLGVSGPVAGKTGTTDDGRDAWMVGYSAELLVVVWVGFDRGKAHGLSGGQAALPAWARFLAGSGTIGAPLPSPKGLVAVELCRGTGLPPCPDCEERVTDWFRVGHEPAPSCESPRRNLLDLLRGEGGGEARPDRERREETAPADVRGEGGRGPGRRKRDRGSPADGTD